MQVGRFICVFFFLNFGWGKSPPTLGTRHDVAIVAVPCYPLYVPPRYAHPLAQGECSHFLCEKVFQKNDRFFETHSAREKWRSCYIRTAKKAFNINGQLN